ncbi:MAG: Fic family protein [Elusimicrobiota bacterium]|jgi:Fic family protein|nr:Fic family protein [Elusimicrobiota bacterium]
MQYIYQNPDWAHFYWDKEKILLLLADIKYKQGLLIGKMRNLGVGEQNNADLDINSFNIVNSAEIEGEFLDIREVRASIARRFGIKNDEDIKISKEVDGMVDMSIDAAQNFNLPITKERLFKWHKSLFPRENSIYKITAGRFRSGLMQVVSGAIGRETVHFEAPPADVLDKEMDAFLDWVNNDGKEDLIIKAAIAHLWFVILHPFDDGNGRIARAIIDMLLSKAENSDKRFYSMSSQILIMRNSYYSALEITQKSSLDITAWLIWFLQCLGLAIDNAHIILKNILDKHHFLQRAADLKLNPRQRKIINSLFKNFKGKLTSSKWAKITKISQDSANRDIDELLKNGLLIKIGAGRNTCYELSK